MLKFMLDENEFLSPYGIRALSRIHKDHPYRIAGERRRYTGRLRTGGIEHRPVRRELQLAGPDLVSGQLFCSSNHCRSSTTICGDDFKVECPTGSGSIHDALGGCCGTVPPTDAYLSSQRAGARPVHGADARYQTDPNWRDLVLFYEYFHGDNGSGVGASHQTGWTGLVAKLLQQSGE